MRQEDPTAALPQQSQLAPTLLILIDIYTSPKELKLFFSSDTFPHIKMAILKIPQICPSPISVDFPPWRKNMDFQIMQKKISERIPHSKCHSEKFYSLWSIQYSW